MKSPVASVFLLAIACGGPDAPRGPAAPPVPAAAASQVPPAAAASQVPPAPARIALAHVDVVDVVKGALDKDRKIVVEGDRIVAVVAGDAPDAPGTRTIDLRGKFVIPGLWDMHVHFADPGSGPLFVANGVTGVRVMWGNPRFAPGMERFHFMLRERFEKKEQVGPRMVIASQILDGPKPLWPMSVALSTADEGRKAVGEAKSGGADFIKVYSLLPRDVFFAIAEESKKQGIPFEGHVPAAVSVAEASDAGQKSIEHLTGLVVACSKKEDALRSKQRDYAKTEHTPAEWSKFRSAQATEAGASYDEKHAAALYAKLVANGTWQCPTLTVLDAMARLDDASLASDPRLAYVSPMIKKQWDPKQDFRTKNRTPEDYVALRAERDRNVAIVRAMNKAGVPLLAGTDEVNPYCFAGFSLHDELGHLVKAGLTPAEALRAATSSPARFLGLESGAIAEKKAADLVVLDADPLVDIGATRKIQLVVSRGAVHDRAALDRMLADAKESAAHPKWGGGGWVE